jgi:hypothetical protein
LQELNGRNATDLMCVRACPVLRLAPAADVRHDVRQSVVEARPHCRINLLAIKVPCKPLAHRARSLRAPRGDEQKPDPASLCVGSKANGMAFSRQGRKRRQVEAVRTGMAFRQDAVVRVSPLRQLGVTRVDLD